MQVVQSESFHFRGCTCSRCARTERVPAGRREIDERTVRSIHDLAARSATYPLLRRVSAFPEPSRFRLAARLGRRLTPTEEAVYSIVRKAIRCGYPGAHVTSAQLEHLTGRCRKSVFNALEGLGPHRGDCPPGCQVHVDLVRTAPMFLDLEWSLVRWTPEGPTSGGHYFRRQVASVYILGKNARVPPRLRAVRQSASGCKTYTPTTPPLKGEEVAAASPAVTPPDPSKERVPSGDEGSGHLPVPSGPATPPPVQQAPERAERAQERSDGFGGSKTDPLTPDAPQGDRATRRRQRHEHQLGESIAEAWASFERNRGGDGGAA